MTKILIIGANNVKLNSIEVTLKNAFRDGIVFTSSDGKNGIELAFAEIPNVILLDNPVSGMSGIEICRCIKKDLFLCDIPIIFLANSENSKETHLLAIEIGVNVFLTHPIDEVELVAQVNAMLNVRAKNISKQFENERLNKLVIEQTEALEKRLIEYKQANEALRETELLYNSFVEHISAGVFRKNSEGRYNFVNSYYCQLKELNAEEIIGKTPLEIVSYKSTHQAQNTLDKIIAENALEDEGAAHHESIMRDGKPIELEEVYPQKDGSIRYFQVVKSPVYSSEGIIIGSQGILFDITDRKKIETDLKDKEERYRTLFAEMLDGFALHEIILDENGKPCDYRFLEMNPSFEKITGLKITDICGKRVLEVLPNAERYWIEIYGKVAITGKSKRFENYSQELNKYFEVVAYSPEKGKFVTIVRDITEHKQAEEKIKESESIFRSIFETAQDGILLLKNSAIIDCNEVTLKLFNCKKEDLIGKSPTDLSPKRQPNKQNSVDLAIQKINDALAGISQQFEWTHSRKGGGNFTVIVNLNRLIVNNEYLLLGIVHDISERIKYEKRIVKSETQLRKYANHLQEVREEERLYISRELHDNLGQSLTALRIDMFRLAKKSSDTAHPKLIELNNEIHQVITYVDSVIQSVRKISRELRPGIIQDLGLLTAIEYQSIDFQKRSGIQCEYYSEIDKLQLNPNDAIGVYRIVQEALTNVLRHAKATKVIISVIKKRKEVVIKVVDNGIGIIDNVVRVHRSLGILGMNERAAIFGGKLSIKGEPNKGTTVTLTIPYHLKNVK